MERHGVDGRPESEPRFAGRLALVGPRRRPDERLGEVPVAVVESTATSEELLESARARLVAYKRPRALFTVSALPRVPNGKIDRAAVVQIELMEPADRGNFVDLAWRSSDDQMDYAVIVAGEEIPQKTVLAQRNHTVSVPVDPLRKYCFSVQATNGLTLAESPPKPIRGATCRS